MALLRLDYPTTRRLHKRHHRLLQTTTFVIKARIYYNETETKSIFRRNFTMSIKMLHTCIRVKDLDKSLAFYTEAFGLKETRRKDFPDHKFTLVYLAFEEGGFELELTYNYDQAEPYDLGNGYGHLAVGVDDLSATHEQFEKVGYSVTDLKGLPGTKPTYFFVMDPDGYKTEVIQNR
ncbi:lactoylglutathione lyase [Listeria booriae]|nr:lactoylglutathione lyase [Listeria booriae]